MEVECNWLNVEVKRGVKVLQPATVVALTQEESFESFGSLLRRVFEQHSCQLSLFQWDSPTEIG